MTTYTLAGGCFWCLDAVFRELKGVGASSCGYSGGSKPEANYYQVATGKTGHAECVQVSFDETILPKEALLDIFFLIHDPTTPNRQGADQGPQYRSAMFYTNDTQKREFEAAVKRAQEHWSNPIVTAVEPLEAFYEAEPEHQDYFANNPANPYCSIVISPKISKIRRSYSGYFKEDYGQ